MVQCIEQNFGVSDNKSALRVEVILILVSNHMWHQSIQRFTRPPLCKNVEVSPSH